jgi:hypothetical protein
MKKIKFFTFSFVFLLFANGCKSQVNILQIPEKYKYPTEFTDYYKSLITVPGTVWVVFSDRNNNKTYESAFSLKEKSSLQFLDKLYVIDEQDHFLHVVKDTEIGESGKLYEDCGWIEKQYLLLWEHCLYSHKKNQEKKAIVINTIDYLNEKAINEGKIQEVFSDPDLKIATNANLEMFDFYYVYKINKNSVLLGNKARIFKNDTINTNIIGWIPINRVAFWDTKIGIEPNWEGDAVKERKKNNTEFKIFADEISAEIYRNKKTTNDNYVIWNEEISQKRNSGDWLRFQLIETKNDIMKIGFQGQIISAVDSLGKNITNKNYISNRVNYFPLNTFTYLKIFTNNKNLRKIYNDNYQLYLTGYLPKKISDSKYPLYKLNIMLTRIELSDLIIKLKKFYEPFLRSENIISFQNEIKKLHKLEIPEISDEEIMNMKVGELLANLFYISSNDKIDNCRFSDLNFVNNISKEDFSKYCNRITSNLIDIEKIFNDDIYEYMYYYKNKQSFYWISEDYLP